jgi:hypothetical protein
LLGVVVIAGSDVDVPVGNGVHGKSVVVPPPLSMWTLMAPLST